MLLLLVFGALASEQTIAVWVTINPLAAWMVAPALGSLGDAAGLLAAFTVCVYVGLATITTLMFWGHRAAARPDAPDELVTMYR